jgi:hypothetical protein
MSLQVIKNSFFNYQDSGSAVITPYNLPGCKQYGFNNVRVNIASQTGDNGIIGYFRVDSTDPTDNGDGGEPWTDAQSYMCLTLEEFKNFKFIRGNGFSNDVFVTCQFYISSNQPISI